MMAATRSITTSLSLLLGLAACGGETTTPTAAPVNGSMAVFVYTTGSDLDNDGYEVAVTPGPRRFIKSAYGSGSGLITANAGTYAVTLERVAPNCTVANANPATVTIVDGKHTNVTFNVECVASGVILTTRTSGVARPQEFPLFVNNAYRGNIPSNDSFSLSGFPAGNIAVRLSLPDHCGMGGASEVLIEIRNRELRNVTLDIACVQPMPREKIAYDRYVLGATGAHQRWIILANPDGSAPMELAPGHSPAWSPDGTRLLLSTTTCDLSYYYGYGCSGGLSILNADTRAVTPLTVGATGTAPAWAPSGDEIAFTRCCTAAYSATNVARLFVARLDGSAERLVFDGSSGDPSWSPDGKWIAFTCVRNAGRTDICIVAKDGTGLVSLTSGAAPAGDPAWSPDGTRIAFASAASGRVQIGVMRADGTGATLLTDGIAPAWSRDGRKLVFARGDGLYTMNVDGTNATRIVVGSIEGAAWRP